MDEGSEPEPRYLRINNHALKAERIISIAGVAIETFCTFLVITLAVKSGNFRKMPGQVRFTLVFMTVFFPATMVYYFVDFGDLTSLILSTLALQNILWACMHWQFTYFYLETAALFKMTF